MLEWLHFRRPSESVEPPPSSEIQEDHPSREVVDEWISDLAALKKIDFADYERIVKGLNDIASGGTNGELLGWTDEDATRALDILEEKRALDILREKDDTDGVVH